MRLKRFIAASALFFCTLRAIACGPGPFILPDNCDLYRLLPYYAELQEPDYGRVAVNCQAWMKAVPDVPETAIRQAIYDFSLIDWQRVQRGDDRGNAFCRRLIDTRDSDAVRLLVWSKYYEQWSEQMRSPWYYGCGMDDGGLDVDSIASVAATYQGRYADRYLLLAMKCLYRGGRNEECEELWKHRKRVMKNSHLCDQAEGYLAACLNRMGRKKEAIDIYVRLGDAASLQLLQDDKVAVFEQVMRHHPNSPFFPVALQRVLFVLENYSIDDRFTKYNLDDRQLSRLLALATRAGRDPRVKDQAMWRYVAACLLDHAGRRHEALKRLNGLMAKDEFLDASIRILRIHLHAQLDRVDDRYEQQLFDDLQWIDNRMQDEWAALDSAERYRLSHFEGFGYNWDVFRTVYSYDALRRIVLGSGGVADRFVRAGRTTRAIQLANMADNRFLQISGNVAIDIYRKGAEKTVYYTWDRVDDSKTYNGYGISIIDVDSSHMKGWCGVTENLFNSHDYSNRLFVHIDRMGADVLSEYWESVENNPQYIDRWLNERGYTDSNYWCDIIGTHLLREMRFREATHWLARVDSSYQYRLNTRDWMTYNPFCYEEQYLSEKQRENYKLHYARTMAYLEILGSISFLPNVRADAMLTFSIALKNAFSERCWPLVSYGYYYGFQDDSEDYPTQWDWEGWSNYQTPFEDPYYLPSCMASSAVAPYAVRAEKRAAELRRKAFATYTDPDRKAQGLKRVYEYTYLMKHYADTPTGQYIARHCDKWKNYLIQ